MKPKALLVEFVFYCAGFYFFAVVTLSCVYSYGVCVAAYFTGNTIFIFHEFLSYYCTAGLPGGCLLYTSDAADD